MQIHDTSDKTTDSEDIPDDQDPCKSLKEESTLPDSTPQARSLRIQASKVFVHHNFTTEVTSGFKLFCLLPLRTLLQAEQFATSGIFDILVACACRLDLGLLLLFLLLLLLQGRPSCQ